MATSRSGPRAGGGWTIAALAAAAVLALGSSGGTAGAGAPADDALHDLHQGLFSRAEERLRGVVSADPADPEARFRVAFVRWWRIVLAESDRGEVDVEFDAAIEAALLAGERRLAERPGSARALASVGGAYILRAHVEAIRKRYFRAAQEARRGKKRLEAALEKDPGLDTALFALGAYNYYADKVPLIVKGLRALLFLPGGDAERGLRQIRTVATSDTPFRTDARLLLAMICGAREEAAYRAALGHLRAALADNPGSPVIGAAIGELQMRLGEYGEAARTFEAALEGASGPERDRLNQRRRLRVALAEAHVADWRLSRGEKALRPMTLEDGSLPGSLRKAMSRVLGELHDKRTAAPFWVEDGDAGKEAGAPARRMLEAARERPDDGVALFLAGRALYLEGRHAEALDALGSAMRLATDPPPWMEGWMELYSGMAEARLGNARAARAHFERAGEVRRFRSADRALLELGGTEEKVPLCAP